MIERMYYPRLMVVGDPIDTAIEALRNGSPECCDRAGLDVLVNDVARVRGWLDAYDTRIALRAKTLATEGRCESPAEVLANRGRRSAVESRAADKRAGVCEQHPQFHDALANGDISAGHVDAMARVSGRLSPAEQAAFNDHAGELLDAAKAMTVDAFATECAVTARDCSEDDGLSELERQRKRRTISRRRDEETGMVITRIELDPLSSERMWNAIDRATKATMLSGQVPAEEGWDHVAVDFVVERITASGQRSAQPAPTPTSEAVTLFPVPTPDAATTDAAVGDDAVDAAVDAGRAEVVTAEAPDVVVLIDWAALSGAAEDAGLLSETLGGVDLPVATVRRLCCQARILPMVLNGAGVTLDVGRSSRLATPDQRRALAAMYATCAVPGCDVGFERCKIHHTREWLRDQGPTDLGVLVPLCDRHHHLVHEGGWSIELDADRTITITRPDGEIHHQGPSPNRRRRPPPTAA